MWTGRGGVLNGVGRCFWDPLDGGVGGAGRKGRANAVGWGGDDVIVAMEGIVVK